jgi:rhodanese-related sulfurtransferase
LTIQLINDIVKELSRQGVSMSEVTIARISAAKARAAMAPNADVFQLVDVRSALEFASEHIKGSIHIPLDEVAKRSAELKKTKPIVLVCRSGARAARAAHLLAPHGFDVSILEGGILAWAKEHLPLVEGKKRLSIERQTQLAIGLTLLASTAGGFLANKMFFVVPAILGAGLTFAGLSGTCGLAVLIAAAPWNKLKEPANTTTNSSCSL